MLSSTTYRRKCRLDVVSAKNNGQNVVRNVVVDYIFLSDDMSSRLDDNPDDTLMPGLDT